MQFQRVIFGVVFGALFGFLSGIGTVTAQSLNAAAGPNELPPSNYKGRQYVDSKGCVYVRAGFGGNVTWVPRVARSRKVICGYKPTFGGSKVAAAPKTQAPPVKKPATVARPVVTVQVPNTPRAPKPMETIASPRIVLQQPKAVPTAPKAQPKPVQQASAVRPCRKASGLERFFGSGALIGDCDRAKTKVVFPGGVDPVKVPAAPVATARTTRIQRDADRTPVVQQPRPVVRTARVAPTVQAPAPVPLAIPKGYKSTWSDDRLNPNRGRGTALGEAQMARVWTNEVPRQLVAQAPQVRRYKPAAKRARSSTKSQQPASSGAATHRFVQVGVYGQPQNARNSIAVLRQMNLPVRTGQFQRKGRTLQIVLAGPFRSQAELTRALGAARGAGFSDAVLRK